MEAVVSRKQSEKMENAMEKVIRILLKGVMIVGVMTVMMGTNAVVFASPVVEVGKNPGTSVSGEQAVMPGGVGPAGVGETVKVIEMVGTVEAVKLTESSSIPAMVDITKLSGADQTDQYIVVLGNGMDSYKVEVGYYKKNAEGIWAEQFKVPGFCGRSGMATDKREGDKRTPTGVYQFVQNFGILADPGSVLPYEQVDEYDFWVDDGKSRYYNQMVSTREVAVDWKSAEPLVQVKPAYNYALALNYNTDARTPGKGSAIFLHGLDPKKDWTSGCIAIPEEQVKLLVQEIDADARIAILPEKPTAETE